MYKFKINYQTIDRKDDSMDIKIRDHIRNNFKNSNEIEIKDSIIESIASKDEVILPGLGVFFEILWNSSNDIQKDEIISILHKNL